MSTTQQGDALTFDGQGTIAAAFSDSQSPNVANITNGTIQLHYNNNTSYSGTITNGTFTNTTRGGDISFTAQVENQSYLVTTPCTASDSNSIILTNGDLDQYFLGAVECSPSSQVGGGNTTTTSTNTNYYNTVFFYDLNHVGQYGDDDRDGIPDSSDRCPHNSNHRCFKEAT